MQSSACLPKIMLTVTPLWKTPKFADGVMDSRTASRMEPIGTISRAACRILTTSNQTPSNWLWSYRAVNTRQQTSFQLSGKTIVKHCFPSLRQVILVCEVRQFYSKVPRHSASQFFKIRPGYWFGNEETDHWRLHSCRRNQQEHKKLWLVIPQLLKHGQIEILLRYYYRTRRVLAHPNSWQILHPSYGGRVRSNIVKSNAKLRNVSQIQVRA